MVMEKKIQIRVESGNFWLIREIRKGLESREESGNLRISGHGSLHKIHLFCSWGREEMKFLMVQTHLLLPWGWLLLLVERILSYGEQILSDGTDSSI